MSFVEVPGPAEQPRHVLVVPHGSATTLTDLAEAWFPGVGWMQEPAQVAGSRPASGARFRGAQADTVTGPGLLTLGQEHTVAGPYPVPAEHTARLEVGPGEAVAFTIGRLDGTVGYRGARPTAYDDRDGIVRAFARGLPEGEELRVVQWAVAVARKFGGVVLADGHELLRPDPEAAVDLSLFSAH